MTMSDPNKIPGSGVITIERHILWEQERFPDSSGALTSLLYDIALAAKLIASRTQRAGLADILGSTCHENVQGGEGQKLDESAQRTLYQLHARTRVGSVRCVRDRPPRRSLGNRSSGKLARFRLQYMAAPPGVRRVS